MLRSCWTSVGSEVSARHGVHGCDRPLAGYRTAAVRSKDRQVRRANVDRLRDDVRKAAPSSDAGSVATARTRRPSNANAWGIVMRVVAKGQFTTASSRTDAPAILEAWCSWKFKSHSNGSMTIARSGEEALIERKHESVGSLSRTSLSALESIAGGSLQTDVSIVSSKSHSGLHDDFGGLRWRISYRQMQPFERLDSSKTSKRSRLLPATILC